MTADCAAGLHVCRICLSVEQCSRMRAVARPLRGEDYQADFDKPCMFESLLMTEFSSSQADLEILS